MMRASPFGNPNLIIHQGTANTFHRIIKLPCVLRVVEEICEVPWGHHWDHGLADIFQFPDNPHASDSALDLGECGLTISTHSFSLPHWNRPDEWLGGATRKPF